MYRYTYISDVCAAISTGGRTPTGSQRASSARALAHTCTWRRCSHMHAHTYTSHRQILAYRHTYRTPLLLFIGGDIHARAQTQRRTRARASTACTQLGVHTSTSAAASTYTRAHIRACVSAMSSPQVPRRTEPRPSAPAAVARRRPKAAHTLDNEVSDAMFHAPMFALNVVAP